MRRKALLGTIVGLMLGTLVVFGPNASAGSATWYSGHVGPGQGLLFSINGKGRAQTFSPVFIDFTLTCSVTGDVFESEFDFFGFAEPVTDGRFDLNLSDPLFQTFDWKGTVDGSTGTGHLTSGFPAYDSAGGLQDCASGNAVWHAKGHATAAAGRAGTRHTLRITITRARDGSITTQVVR